jgi:hypothetical protein
LDVIFVEGEGTKCLEKFLNLHFKILWKINLLLLKIK